jgi:(methylthio)acryloyl-CoA hydratase
MHESKLADLAATLPSSVRIESPADGEGERFSAGLDLSELSSRDIPSGTEHSRLWHRIVGTIQFGPVPAPK